MKPTSANPRAGLAIIVILLILVLLTAVTVAFLSRTSLEMRSSAADRASAKVIALADIAVGVVQSQINEATRQSDVSWASQPGAVRTFNTSGDLVAVHKLYSALTLSATSVATLRTEDAPPANWASRPAEWTNLNAWVETEGVKRYPILDPTAANDPTKAEGFTIDPNHPADTAMPVRWLYVLENGQLVAPEASGTKVLVAGSDSSAIVGRIAFWTDDETAKINLNTAGDGTYWDAPRAFSTQEGDLADRQPFINEFQRYPGHPGTTSLLAAFPFLTGEQVLKELTPRYRWGGSEAGTLPTTSQNAILDLRGVTTRLYASVDELVFAPDRSESRLSREEIEQRRFLLTAQSRAPELNLFNLPRMAIWPIHATDSPTYRTAIDREIARCSTINGEPYYLQRSSALSPTADFAIPRNETLYNYLASLLGRPVPGFGGGNFATKYPNNESRQILTQIFDVIRCANLFDTVLDASKGQPFTSRRASGLRVATPGHGQAAPLRHPSNGTMGFGRFYTLSEASLHLICTADEATSSSNDPEENRTLEEDTPLAKDERRLQAAFLFELFSPAAGWSILHPSMEVEITGLENILVNGNAVFPASANGSTQINASQRSLVGGRGWGSNPGVRYPLFLKYAPARGRVPADTPLPGSYAHWEHLYPFISDPFTIDHTAGMAISLSGPVRMQLYSVDPASPTTRTLVQTIEIPEHPARATRVPTLAPDNKWWTFSRSPALSEGSPGRLNGLSSLTSSSTSPGASNARWFNTADVVVSWLPSHGDYRLVAASHNLPAANSPFAPHPSWSASSSFATTLYDNLPNYLLAGLYTGGKYRNAISYPAAAMPDRPPGGAEVTTGDWDRGFADMLDGPYINKPDEGTTTRPTTTTSGFGGYPYFAELASSTSDIGNFFSPTRQMPSAGVFGSLPTGVARGLPWQTLLFRPQAGHPGAAAPKDHLLLDLFWMPVVEPYAISEPFSTAGKINLNYEILPFSTITRATGLHALLKGEKIAAIATGEGARYADRNAATPNTAQYRLEIDTDETLQQFTQRFANDDIFRAASEICDLWIVPKGQTAAGMPAFWNNHLLTAENLRERIYTTLYPRVTTQSNTFTVHLKVQTLKAGPGMPSGEWVEARGQITGEYEAAVLIERYLNPNSGNIPDYASQPGSTPSLPDLYRWRTLSQLRFAP